MSRSGFQNNCASGQSTVIKLDGGTGSSDAWDAAQWHQVKKGETLWKIAEHYYGDGTLYRKIFEANQDILKSKLGKGQGR